MKHFSHRHKKKQNLQFKNVTSEKKDEEMK